MPLDSPKRPHARHLRWTCRLRSLDRDGSLHALLQATLRADINLKPGDVSVTTWMGYDSPMNVFTDAPSTSYAHDGAPALDSFQAGLRASHVDVAAAGPSVNTVIGHSYGSTLVGAAG